MQTTLLSSKGQIIIPKTLRVARHWGPGTRLEVHDTSEGVLLKHVAPANKVDLKSGLQAIRNRVAYAGAKLSLADMDAAVMREASRTSPTPASKTPRKSPR